MRERSIGNERKWKKLTKVCAPCCWQKKGTREGMMAREKVESYFSQKSNFRWRILAPENRHQVKKLRLFSSAFSSSFLQCREGKEGRKLVNQFAHVQGSPMCWQGCRSETNFSPHTFPHFLASAKTWQKSIRRDTRTHMLTGRHTFEVHESSFKLSSRVHSEICKINKK